MTIVQTAPLAAAVLLLAACTPTPPAGGGGGGGGGVNSNCAFSATQTSQGLRMDCGVSGSPPNRLLNPTGGSGCKFESFSLFGQAVSANATFVYGENGDESASRVRIGAVVNDGASHSGQLGKSAGDNCSQTVGPIVSVNTAFGGTHVALIDKMQTPMCVFQSRFVPSSFSQTISAGLSVDVGTLARDASLDAVARTLDLEAARAVNRLLRPSADLGGGFSGRAGRCADGWQPFSGS